MYIHVYNIKTFYTAQRVSVQPKCIVMSHVHMYSTLYMHTHCTYIIYTHVQYVLAVVVSIAALFAPVRGSCQPPPG